MKLLLHLCALAVCASLVGCDDEKDGGGADAPATSAASKKAAAVKTGGSFTYKESGKGREPVEVKVGKAFAYVVTDTETDGEGKEVTVHKLAEIAIYNEGAKDVTCKTKLQDFDDEKLLPGSHYAVLLRGRNFQSLTWGKPMAAGDEYAPCVWHPGDFGKGTVQRSGCGFSSVDMSTEDIKLTKVDEDQIHGAFDVTSSVGSHPSSVKGTFVAEVCPIVSLDEYLENN